MTKLSPECERTLETCLTGDDPLPEEARRHLDECASCDALAQQMADDRDRLVRHFSTAEVPPPTPLRLHGGVHSASGHPRRISLTLLPILLLLFLLVSILVVSLTLWIVKRERGQLEGDLRRPATATEAPREVAPDADPVPPSKRKC